MVALAGQGWKLAPSLVAMVDEADRIAPSRNRKADGSIGDQAHQARKSGHNPSGGYVHALDLTHAPASGFDAHARARLVIARRDPRIKFVISDRMIAASYSTSSRRAWTWGPYSGSNPHTFHAHFEINETPTARSEVSPWWPHNEEGDELTMAQIDDIMAKLDVIHSEQTRQHSRVVELLEGLPAKVRSTVYTARDGLAKLIRELHG